MKLFIMAALFLSYSSAVHAAWDTYYGPKAPVQVAKQAQRWSLKQWMEQKGNMQWQDMWLRGNSSTPSLFEGYIGGEYTAYDRGSVTTLGPLVTDGEFKASGAHAGLYLGWFGLSARYENSSDEDRHTLNGLANLRLLGASDQGSNFVLFYGARAESFLGDKVLNQQAGASMQLYLFDPWAVQGRYHHYLEADSDRGNQIDGYRVEVTTWLEYGAIRFFGSWFYEPITMANSLGSMTTRREGFNAGLRIYLDFKK